MATAKKNKTKSKKTVVETKAIKKPSKSKKVEALSVNESKTGKDNASKSFSQQLKLSDSYVSLALGAAVVFVIAVLFFVVIKGNKEKNINVIVNTSPTPKQVTNNPNSKRIYIVQEGESIWDVAVKEYGDGYKWVLIAQANNLIENADSIEAGTKLIIPPVK